MNQYFLLSADESWASSPTTKVRRPKPSEPFAWCYSYTGFSLDFARTALKRLGATPSTQIVDPFVGSGTTIAASVLEGCSCVGVDIDAFSALLSRTRIAASASSRRVHDYLNAREQQVSSPSDLLHPRDDAYVAGVVAKICNERGLKCHELWSELLGDQKGSFDDEGVVLLAMALGARQCVPLSRGSNPIWFRKSPTITEQPSLKQIALSWAENILRDVIHLLPSTDTSIRVENIDFLTAPLSRVFNVCLTSPPYLNRLDYVIAHLPELAVLGHVTPVDLEKLRASMIGTTKIVSKKDTSIPDAWGQICKSALESIWNHPSYASRRYYFYTFRQYFERLNASLTKLTDVLTTDARGVIVAQNSYYKDVNIPTPAIISEMLQGFAWKTETVRTTPVKSHMGLMDPEQIGYAPRKALGEAIIHFHGRPH